ncbi:FAD-dependent oxidoreductase [Pseudorhodoplanes sp.]|uniref:FAD-dependent oxidoreductase n=1 Tax=Pseudorhodoplanes sp. TaxID=1934341 RepID=UPI00391AE247
MSERFEGVVVAGAGPVGLVAALKIARAGIPVQVLDCEPDIIPWPRAVVYHAPTVEMLDRLGLLDELKVAGILKQDYQFRTVDGDILAAPHMSVLTPQDTAYPFNLHMPQHELARAILRRFLAIPGAAVHWNTRVTAVAQDGDSVTVTVDQGGETRTIRCDWLVGSDGGSSTVRRAVGLSFDGYTHPERLVSTNLVYDFEARGFARANFIIDPKYWAVVVKIDRHGLWRITYGEDASLPEETVKDRIADHYRAILPDSDPYELEAFAPFRVHERCAPSFRAGRVLLAGDAAHVCNPYGGLGLTSGLLDADLLGDALPAVILREADDDLLDRYAAERRRVFVEVTGPTAAENKRRLKETDPDKKKADNERFHRLHNDPQFQREALTFTYKLLSRPIGLPEKMAR